MWKRIGARVWLHQSVSKGPCLCVDLHCCKRGSKLTRVESSPVLPSLNHTQKSLNAKYRHTMSNNLSLLKPWKSCAQKVIHHRYLKRRQLFLLNSIDPNYVTSQNYTMAPTGKCQFQQSQFSVLPINTSWFIQFNRTKQTNKIPSHNKGGKDNF